MQSKSSVVSFALTNFTMYSSVARTNTSVPSKPTDLPFSLNYLDCNGDEERLVDCPSSTSSYCYASETAGVDCLVAPPNITQGQVRLDNPQQHGNHVTGVLKIFIQGEWGYFCGELAHNVSQVACRSLGYYDKGTTSLSPFWFFHSQTSSDFLIYLLISCSCTITRLANF